MVKTTCITENNKIYYVDKYDSGFEIWLLKINNEWKIHREIGPAIISSTGEKQYYLNDKRYFVNSAEELIIADIIE